MQQRNALAGTLRAQLATGQRKGSRVAELQAAGSQLGRATTSFGEARRSSVPL